MLASLQYSLCSVSPSPSLFSPLPSSPQLSSPPPLRAQLTTDQSSSHLSQLNIISLFTCFLSLLLEQKCLEEGLGYCFLSTNHKAQLNRLLHPEIKGVTTPTWGTCARSLYPRPFPWWRRLRQRCQTSPCISLQREGHWFPHWQTLPVCPHGCLFWFCCRKKLLPWVRCCHSQHHPVRLHSPP